jgi:hypothetical protein
MGGGMVNYETVVDSKGLVFTEVISPVVFNKFHPVERAVWLVTCI